jgi:hypothetical protein
LNCIHQQNIFRKTNKAFFVNIIKDYSSSDNSLAYLHKIITTIFN